MNLYFDKVGQLIFEGYDIGKKLKGETLYFSELLYDKTTVNMKNIN